jgi:alkylation response protein AidB-like acyl-CoA dehydrogenase
VDYLKAVSQVIADVVAPSAAQVDESAAFPRPAIEALGKAGLLGLVSAEEVGGLGEGHRAASAVVEALARACASTAQNCLEQMSAVGQAGGDRGRSGRALVAVVKPVDFGDGDDRPGGKSLAGRSRRAGPDAGRGR